MGTQHGRINDAGSDRLEHYESRGRRGAGSLMMAALLGVGIGLLAAPQPGARTRKLLARRLAALGEDMSEGMGEVQDVGSKARKRVKRRLARLREDAGEEWQRVPERLSKARSRFRDEEEEEEEEEEESGSFGKVLALAAGLAATYFMTSERTADARSRVQETAAVVGRRATDGWDRFQRGGIQGLREAEGRSETRTSSNPSDEAPQAS